MKLHKVISKYRLGDVASDFSKWLEGSSYELKFRTFTGYNEETGKYDKVFSEVEEIPDEIVDEVVSSFEKWYPKHLEDIAKQAEAAARAAELEVLQAEAAVKKKQQETAAMLITSGFSFEGYKITKYSGYISGDDVVQIDRGSQGFFQRTTDVGAALMESLVDIRRNALQELKEAAHALGCNAVIGVDFDYLIMDPETVNASGGTLYMPYVFGVTANGNAVIVEKAK